MPKPLFYRYTGVSVYPLLP
uniref:Uncharacterized protein n=1 Tax=Arundo donax TaxID=35708 RepID=A0A0A9FJS9_ARUDO